MKQLAVVFLFLLSIQTYAQDYKWSVEANYPISVGDDLGNDNPGIADVGLKYRFADFSFVKLGAGLNIGMFHDKIKSYTTPELYDFKETNWIFQPKVFAEFKIPGISKLRPSIGVGYTLFRDRFKGRIDENIFDSSYNDGGLNLNIGLSYDISKRFFIQAQYDYFKTENTFEFEGTTVDVKNNLGFLKFGLGFRF